MDSNPLVSILVPVYGVEKYVAECVDSIFNQTYENIEVIFVNDCTPDKSRKIIQQKINDNPQINARIIDNAVNMGSATTRNVAIETANGEYLCFVDSDDILPQRAVERMVDAANEFGADIVRGGIERFNSYGHMPFSQRMPVEIIDFRRALLNWGKYPLGVCGGLYNRDLFVKNNLRFFDGLNFGEDFGVTSRLAYYAKSVEVIDDIVYFYRINDQSMTQTYKEKNAVDIIEISNRIKSFYESMPDYTDYREAMFLGRARIKTIMLMQLAPGLVPKYRDVFPELRHSKLPPYIRATLWATEQGYRNLYKILNRLKPLFRHT